MYPAVLLKNFVSIFIRFSRGYNFASIQKNGKVKERVELYLNSTYGRSWRVIGWTLPLHYLRVLSSPVTCSIDVFQPRPTVSSQVFQVVFFHSVYNSTIFLTPCCCSLLLHVVASLVRIFLVSRQLTFSSSKISLFLLRSKTMNRAVLLKKLHLDLCRPKFFLFFASI